MANKPRISKRVKTVKPTSTNPITKNNLSIKDFSPIGNNQVKFKTAFEDGKHCALMGYPGTGKTFMAMLESLKAVERGEFKRIVIVRSAVATKDIGHLPGTLKEKGDPFEEPYKDICADIFNNGNAYETLKLHDGVRFGLTSYVRGKTIKDSVIIFDEFQNASSHELDSVLTRLGETSRLIICGDLLQTDLTREKEKRDVDKFLKVIKNVNDYFEFVNFDVDDIIRSGLVRYYIKEKCRQYPDGF